MVRPLRSGDLGYSGQTVFNVSNETTPSFQQSWTLDKVHNWTETDILSDSNTQTRTHNAVNELTERDGPYQPDLFTVALFHCEETNAAPPAQATSANKCGAGHRQSAPPLRATTAFGPDRAVAHGILL